MKRSVLNGLTLLAFVLSLSLVGCGSAGVEQGVPVDTSNVKPLPSAFTDMSGRMSKDIAKAKAKAAVAEKAAAASAPATEPPK